MIEYALRDIDDNEFELSGSGISTLPQQSLTYLNEPFSWQNNIVERSSLAGSVAVGKNRLRERRITFEYSRSEPVLADFRNDENELIEWLNKTYWLVDKTNSLRVRAIVEKHMPEYDLGGHKLSGNGRFDLVLLDPFWESTNESTDINAGLTGSTDINIDIEGYVAVSPIIEFDAAAAVTGIEIYLFNNDNVGIEITDAIFGTAGFLNMLCDCKEGTLLIGDLDRKASITPGTGFFQLPPLGDADGGVDIRIIVSAACDVDFKWRPRYFI